MGKRDKAKSSKKENKKEKEDGEKEKANAERLDREREQAREERRARRREERERSAAVEAAKNRSTAAENEQTDSERRRARRERREKEREREREREERVDSKRKSDKDKRREKDESRRHRHRHRKERTTDDADAAAAAGKNQNAREERYRSRNADDAAARKLASQGAVSVTGKIRSASSWSEQAAAMSRGARDGQEQANRDDGSEDSVGAHMHRFRWYWPRATREQCDSALAWEKAGAFIVRSSTRPGCLALSVQQRPRGGRMTVGHAVLERTAGGWQITIDDKSVERPSVVKILQALYPFVRLNLGVPRPQSDEQTETDATAAASAAQTPPVSAASTSRKTSIKTQSVPKSRTPLSSVQFNHPQSASMAKYASKKNKKRPPMYMPDTAGAGLVPKRWMATQKTSYFAYPTYMATYRV